MIVDLFLQRLALPYIHASAFFCTGRHVKRHVASLESNPALGSRLTSIQFRKECWELYNTPLLAKFIGKIVACAPHLTRINPIGPSSATYGASGFDAYLTIPWSAFETMSNTAGPKMVSLLDVEILHTGQPTPVSPLLLSQFSALHELGCFMQPAFDTAVEVTPSWLENLEFLNLRGCHASFIDVMSKLR